MTGRSVVLTQPYIANYRVPLLDRISELFIRDGVDFHVYTGRAGGQQAMRHDDSGLDSLGYAAPMPIRTMRVGERYLEWRRLPRSAGRIDVLVTELSAQNSIGWRYALSRRAPCILWGHGKTFTHRSSTASTALKVRLAKMTAHSMLYSSAGRDYLELRGVPRSKMTVIGNATDSELLQHHVAALGASAGAELRSALGIAGRTKVALFVGGLDGDKRIDFLLEAATLAGAADPTFCLLVLGRGRLEDQVRRCEAGGGAVRWLGAAGPELVARAGAVARCIWMPGRIGLVAVDALVLRLPVHTTAFPFHAPEADLLVGSTKLVLPDDPRQFAHRSLLAMNTDGPRAWPAPPTVDQVAHNFVDVVLRYL